MRAGRLRHVITIQKMTETKDSYGAPVKSWENFAVVRAAIEPLNGREFFAAQSVRKENTIRFRLRYVAGLTEDMRIIHDSKSYHMIAPPINNDLRNNEITIMATDGNEEDINKVGFGDGFGQLGGG